MAAVMRILILTHRYLGIAVGLLMTLWCLSGFVMMYQSFPELTAAERLRGLAPLQLTGCCDPARIALADDTSLTEARIEMAAGEPVLRLARSFGPTLAYRLRTGEPLEELTQEEVAAVARDYAAGAGLRGRPGPPQRIEFDQWTVASAGRNQPVWKIAFDDPAASVIYVSGASGQVFMDTDRKERLLGWLGAVPHWLYPSLLRQNGPLWTQVVIWSSVVGTFLTVLGLWIGIVRFKRRSNGRWSPYRGLMWQHHVPGLAFGLLTLTWVFSGLMTMGPWGLLDSAAGQVRRAIVGETTWGEAKALLAAAPRLVGPGVVQVEAAPLGGTVRLLSVEADGRARRFDTSGRPAPVAADELRRAAAAAGAPVESLALMQREDGYYYAHHDPVALPVWRLVLADPGRTHLYVHPETGKVLRAADAPARANRWIETGLHDLDFAWIRKRPVWDLVVLPLLAGVTFVCGTGTWLGFRRIGRDVERLRLALRRAGAKKSARA